MVSEIHGVKVHDDVIIFQRDVFVFFGHILTDTRLDLQFNAEQSFLGNHGLIIFDFQDTEGQIRDDVIIFQTDVLIFSNMSICVP